MTRIARNVKYKPSRNQSSMDSESASRDNVTERFEYAEVQYYFPCRFGDETRALAMVLKYGTPNEDLLKASSGVVWACCKLDTLAVIDIKCIEACVAMIPSDLPHPDAFETNSTVYFAVDKLGVDIGHLGETDEPDEENSTGEPADGSDDT